MEKYFSDPFWLLGAIGWIVGIVSGILQIKSYREQKKNEGGYSQLLEEAALDRKAQFTKDQLTSMAREMQRLEESIKRDIPQKARRVFLEDQLSKVKEDLAQNYLQYEEIISKLSADGTKLPDQIQRAVEESIMPSYLSAKRESANFRLLLGVAVFLLIIVNWDFFMGIIHVDDWVYGSGSTNFPSSWLIVLGISTYALVIIIKRTFIGRGIQQSAQKLKRSISESNKDDSLIKSFLRQLFLVVTPTFIFGGVILLFALYFEFSGGQSYGRVQQMPLDRLPFTLICALPFSIISLFLFYLFKRKPTN